MMCGILLAEIVVRVMVPDASRQSTIDRLTNERVVWARPDPKFHHIGDGLHRLAFPKPEALTERRILVIGDSFAMGERVGEKNRFGTLLQRELGDSVQVDVLAVTGYSPVIYQNVLDAAFQQAKYRAVVIAVDQTDPVDDLIYAEDVLSSYPDTLFDVQRMADREKALHTAYSALLKKLSRSFSFRAFALYNLFQPPSIADDVDPNSEHYQYIQRSLRRPQLIGQFLLNPNSEPTKRMEELLIEHLDRIVSQCSLAHVPVVMFANPWEFQTATHPRITLGLPGPFPKDNRLESVLLRRYGAMAQVHVLELTGYLRSQPNPSQLYVDNPGHEFHWNSKGHAAVGAILSREFSGKIDLR